MEDRIEYQLNDDGIESWLAVSPDTGDTEAHAKVHIRDDLVPEEKRPLYFHVRMSCTGALRMSPGGCRKEAAREAAIQSVERAMSELICLGFDEYSKAAMKDSDS